MNNIKFGMNIARLRKEKGLELALISLLLRSKKSMIWHSYEASRERKTDIKKQITSENEKDKTQIRRSKRHSLN